MARNGLDDYGYEDEQTPWWEQPQDQGQSDFVDLSGGDNPSTEPQQLPQGPWMPPQQSQSDNNWGQPTINRVDNPSGSGSSDYSVDTSRPEYQQALARGVSDATLRDFLGRNQGDYHRLHNFDRPTFSNGGIGGDDDLNSDGIADRLQGGPSFGPPRGQPTPTPRPQREYLPSLQDILRDLGALGAQYGGPQGGGVFPDPVQQVGQDPLSQLITGGYADLIGNRGQTPLGADIDATLRGIIERRGEVDEDPKVRAQRIEAKRQPIESFRRTQTNQMRGELANRGLISEPGMAQGAEISSLGRIEQELAPHYATAAQSLVAEDAQASNQRLSQALNLATGLSQAQSQAFLATLQSATQRQAVLADIALQTLDRNILWNQFLAQLGLQRDQIMYGIQQGQVDDLKMLITMFQQFLGASMGGFI